MITGDNTLTGSNISYKCSISDKKKGLIIVDFVNKKLIEENFIFHDYDNTKDFPADKPLASHLLKMTISLTIKPSQSHLLNMTISLTINPSQSHLLKMTSGKVVCQKTNATLKDLL